MRSSGHWELLRTRTTETEVKEAHMSIPSDRVEYFDTRADLPEVGCTIIAYYAVDEDEFYYYTPSAGWH